MSEKKITLLINSLSGGGAEGVCVNLANGLNSRGWRVEVVVLHLNNAVRQKELNKSVRLVVLGSNHARTSFFTISRYLIQGKPEKILVFNHQLALLLVVLRAIMPRRFTIIARNINTLSRKKDAEKSYWHKYFVHWLTKLLYGKVDQIIAQSKGMAEDLVSFYRVDRKKVLVIHNPISSRIESFALPANIEKKEYLLCVGRLESQKAFQYAISAFAAIAGCYPNLRLKFVGKGSLEEQLKKQCLDLGLADRVDFEGYKNDVIPYILYAKVMLLTSIYEGFPNVLVEAISLGTPVVAFNCPSGPDEIVVEGENGYLAKYRDINDLVKKIQKVLEDPIDKESVLNSALRFRRDAIITQYEKTIL